MNQPAAVSAGAVRPSGDATGKTDTASIQAALNAAFAAIPHGVVRLAAGLYSTNRPLIIPPGVALVGAFANEVAEFSAMESGTIIQGAAGFSQGRAPGNAMVLFLSRTDGGYSVTSEEQKLFGLMLDGSLIAATTVNDGIRVVGGCKRIHLERVLVARMNGNGVNIATGTDGAQANALRLDRVNIRYAGQAGFVVYRSSDITCRDCLAENCNQDGWDITNASNGLFLACRSEHNKIGFNFVTTQHSSGSGGQKFVGCSTDRNQSFGMRISSSNGAGTPVSLTGCVFRRDGANSNLGGGNLAGLSVTSFPSVVLIAGCTVFPGANDDGTGQNSPQIGLNLAGNAPGKTVVVISGSYFQGDATAVSDDGTSNTQADAATSIGTGPTTSQDRVIPPLFAALSGRSLRIGDTSIRLRVSSHGTLAWEPGTGAADCSLGRITGGVAGAMTGDFAVDAVGRGLQVKEGANCKQGTVQLSAGTATVANSAVTDSSRIFLTSQADGGTPGWLRVSARVAGASFTVTSSSSADTSTVAYEIFEPAP